MSSFLRGKNNTSKIKNDTPSQFVGPKPTNRALEVKSQIKLSKEVQAHIMDKIFMSKSLKMSSQTRAQKTPNEQNLN